MNCDLDSHDHAHLHSRILFWPNLKYDSNFQWIWEFIGFKFNPDYSYLFCFTLDLTHWRLSRDLKQRNMFFRFFIGSEIVIQNFETWRVSKHGVQTDLRKCTRYVWETSGCLVSVNRFRSRLCALQSALIGFRLMEMSHLLRSLFICDHYRFKQETMLVSSLQVFILSPPPWKEPGTYAIGHPSAPLWK